MNPMPFEKYRAFAPVDLPDRQWPTRRIDRAPSWCSVDLRDGNQALIDPMDGRRKMHMFQALVDMGFKEIEVGFPSASKTDFDFVRLLIEEDRIPPDVTIQVLTQARDELIRRTYESLAGCRRAIVHLYNSTSTLQRRVVFETDRAGIVEIAVNGARLVRELAQSAQESEIVYQYSPESFTGTELDFAVEICEAVCDVWEPTLDRKAIINLPATVEMATPNIYADQIEWFIRHFRYRDRCIISLHPHNDRGTGVAAAELGVMAGADRVEGTLFGNGERTGNVDVVNLAMNLFTQGIDPELDLSDIDRLKGVAEFCNQLPIHPRHPYAGELVYTAFSGSHQDAIKKGMQALERSNSRQWEVPYLPLDPKDVGRDYEAIIRVNSQSGKGGVAYLMKADHGLDLPRGLQIEFSRTVQQATERSGREIDSEEIRRLFEKEYLLGEGTFSLVEHWSLPDPDAPGQRRLDAVIRRNGEDITIKGRGNGPIAAFVDALESGCGIKISVRDYNEHALGRGADATAVAYVEVADEAGKTLFGVGRDPNITIASLMAILGAVNRHLARR
ncbi:2-isopropylmalate synthase [Thioalkalivibrio sp. HK1]|uniref:2-isopropylmalate synthase n=1 Tax=Thioalkalivibrio sp. HK1 TaxID=1469245 RepID=UPI000471110B